MKNLNILVTGGARYVGSVLISSLIEDNHYVKCLDRFIFASSELVYNDFKNRTYN